MNATAKQLIAWLNEFPPDSEVGAGDCYVNVWNGKERGSFHCCNDSVINKVEPTHELVEA